MVFLFIGILIFSQFPVQGQSIHKIFNDAGAPGYWNDRAVVIGQYFIKEDLSIQISTVVLSEWPIVTDKRLLVAGMGNMVFPVGMNMQHLDGGWAIFCLVHSPDNHWSVDGDDPSCMLGSAFLLSSRDDPRLALILTRIKAAFLDSISTSAARSSSHAPSEPAHLLFKTPNGWTLRVELDGSGAAGNENNSSLFRFPANTFNFSILLDLLSQSGKIDVDPKHNCDGIYIREGVLGRYPYPCALKDSASILSLFNAAYKARLPSTCPTLEELWCNSPPSTRPS